MAKVKAKPEAMTTVIYRGEREELQGIKFKVPANVVKKALYIEREHDRQQAEAAAKAAAEAEELRLAEEREAALMQMREAAAAAEAEALDDVPEPEAEAPQGSQELQLAASLSNVTGSLLTQSREVEQLQAQVAEQQQTIEQLIEQLNVAGIEKSEALKLVKNNQLMMNGLMESTTLQIEAMQASIRAANSEAETYRQAMLENAETVRQAARITDEVKNIAMETANEAADEQFAMTMAAANATLRASGVTRSQFLQILNAGQVQGKEAVIATQAELQLYVRLLEAFQAQEVETAEQLAVANQGMAKQSFDEQVAAAER